MDTRKDYVEKLLRRPLWNSKLMQGLEVPVVKQEFDLEGVGGDKLAVTITIRTAFFDPKAMKELTGGNATADACLRQYVQTYDLEALAKITSKGGLSFTFEGKKYELKYKKHFALGPGEATWL